MKRTGHILLVEDDKFDQLLIKNALKHLNISNSLVIKENGEEALDYLKTNTDNLFLILCDINMPRMNGRELKEHIEKENNLKYRSIPFVYLSTSSDPGDIKAAYDLNAQSYFSKPSTFEKTINLLSSIISYWNYASVPLN
jgi:CheY-like chemotaxis protein